MRALITLGLIAGCASSPEPEAPLLILPPSLERRYTPERFVSDVSVMVVGQADCRVSLLPEGRPSESLGVSPVVFHRLVPSEGTAEVWVRCPDNREYREHLAYRRGDSLKIIVTPGKLTSSDGKMNGHGSMEE